MLACCEKPRGASPEEQVMTAAETYYSYLVNEQPDSFLKGRYGMDNIPESFRKALINRYKQFADDQKKNHGGIVKIKATNVKDDSLLQLTQVFLNLIFADSTREEIVIPMVKDGDTWKMK